MARMLPPLSFVRSSPSKRICPAVGFTSWTMLRAMLVLPHPLSPTSPSVSPLGMLKLTLSTAFTAPTFF